MTSSLTRIYLRVFLIVLLCLAAASYAGYWVVRDAQQSAYQAKATQTAHVLATDISEFIDQQRLAVEKNAQQTALIDLLQHITPAQRDRKEAEIKSLLAGAIAVHLLPRNNAGEVSPTEAVDPACIEYIRRVSAANAPAAPEFHALGSSAGHYDLAAPIRDENKKLLGYLLVSFARAPLQAVIEESLTPGAYFELQQAVGAAPAQTVITAGKIPTSNAPLVTTSLGNSPWTMLYQTAEVAPKILSGNRIYYIGFILILFLLISVMLFHFYRRTVNAIRHDVRSLIRMFHDLREGSVRVEYPMELREFSDIFDYLRDRGQKLVNEKEKMKDMGLMDHLSQLANRRHFEMRLKDLFEASKTHGPSSVLIIDMDHFKAVNDKHGHDAGDALIVGFANALRKVVRQTDVLARLGGDEFCIIYAYASFEKAQALAERLRKHLPREISLPKGVSHPLRWTGGLSVMDDKDTKPDDVLWRADQALLQAKEGGRNITKIYDPATGQPEKKRIVVG
ncbi:MAG: diguanylate cyclase [Gammaproteobacteria bacterium]|nr:diguanylate cyclase [Gammaproteobacteria bacterium]